MFLIREENYLNLAYDDCSWIVDPSAVFHVTPHEHFFLSGQGGNFSKVKIANQASSEVIVTSDITLVTNI